MRNIVDDSTFWVKVRRLGLLTSLVFAIATAAIGQVNSQQTDNVQPPPLWRPPLQINEKSLHYALFADSVPFMDVVGNKAIENPSFVTVKEIVTYKNDDSVGNLLTAVVILLQLASIWILLHYWVKPKRDSADNGERDAKIKGLNKEIKDLNSAIEDWCSLTESKTPQKAKEFIGTLKSECVKIQNEKNSLEIELIEFQKKVKDNPKSFEGNPEYKKLSELIENSKKFCNLGDDPTLVDKATKTGKLIAAGMLLDDYLKNPIKVTAGNHANSQLASFIRKGIFLDKAKDDLQVVIGDKAYIAGSILQKAVSCVKEPYNIVSTNLNTCGLYKLVSDLNTIAAAVRESKDIKSVETSDETRDKLKPLIDGLVRYQKFGTYQNYWSNIKRPLFDVLDKLPNNDQTYNMRALMFYCSQFYSIVETICNIYQGNTNSDAYEWNVELFNKASAPVIGSYGIPDIPDNELEKFEFQYSGAPGEDERRSYFIDHFSPMRYILISTYYK